MGRKRIHPHLVGAYVYLIVVNGIVRYVGKGRRHRVIHHFSVAKAINRDAVPKNVMLVHRKLAKAILGSKTKVGYRVIANDLSDDDAFALEMQEIASYPKGQLWNVAIGGIGNAEGLRRAWNDLATRAKWIEAIARGHQDPDYRKRARVTANLQWGDLEHRANFMKSHRAIWDDPIAAAERCALLKAAWANNEDGKEKVRIAVTKAWTPERRAAMAENRRRFWSDPIAKAKAIAAAKATKQKRKEEAQQWLLIQVK